MQFKIASGEPIGSQLPDTPAGLSPYSVGAGLGWSTAPSQVSTVADQVTVTTSATIDWSAAGIFQFLLTASQAFAPSFANVTVGQTILLLLKQPSGSAHGTFTTGNLGTFILAGTAAGTVTLGCASTYSGIDAIQVTCISPGVYRAVQN
jgi:hypothetical protein